MYISQLQQ